MIIRRKSSSNVSQLRQSPTLCLLKHLFLLLLWLVIDNNRGERSVLSSAYAFQHSAISSLPSSPSFFIHKMTASASTNGEEAAPIIKSIVHNNSKRKKQKHNYLHVLWKFSRPHTIIGSALAIPALHLLAAPTYRDALTIKTLASITYATIPALLMNLYITGLNEITDVEIDKINKPDLPIASGELSIENATIIVIVALVLSIVSGMMNAIPSLSTGGLSMALSVSAVLGTLYSLRPFRLKRFPVLAAFCIVAVRGAVINAGFFAHASVAAFGSSHQTILHYLMTDPRCYLSSLYFAVFGVVIALMKDVPDVKGDCESNIRSFAVRLGPARIYRGMHRLLTTLFWGVGVAFFRGAATAAVDASSMIRLGGRLIIGVSALLAGISVQREAAPIDPENPKEVYGFYMHLWKLFYLSYFVLPLAR